MEISLLVLYFREKDPTLCKSIMSVVESVVSTSKKDESECRKFFDTVINHRVDDSAKSADQLLNEDKVRVNQMESIKREIHTILPAQFKQSMLMEADKMPRMMKRVTGGLRRQASPKVRERALSICRAASIEDNDDDRKDRQISRSQSEDDDDDLSLRRSVSNSKTDKKDREKNRLDSQDYSRDFSPEDRPVSSPRAYQRQKFDGIIEEQANNQVVVPQKKHETTKEYIERDYYFNKEVSKSRLNVFWMNTIRGLFERGKEYVNLDYNFIFCAESLIDMVAVLALSSLSFTKAVVESKKVGDDLVVQVKSGKVIQFCKQMNEGIASKIDMDIIVSQRFFDPLDKYIYEQPFVAVK